MDSASRWWFPMSCQSSLTRLSFPDGLGLWTEIPCTSPERHMLIPLLLTAAEYDPKSHVLDVVLSGTPDAPVLTMHMVTLAVSAILTVLVMVYVASKVATGPASEGNDRFVTQGRLSQFVESMVCWLRDEMIEPVLGERGTKRWLPLLLTLFFFILINNLIGLIPLVDMQHLAGSHDTPIGGTATGNLAITLGLALVSFVIIHVHGIKESGFRGWIMHNFAGLPVFGLNSKSIADLALLPISIAVFLIELLGHLIKPAALAIRLFANMVAGHTVMAALFGLGLGVLKDLTGPEVGTVIGSFAGFAFYFLELFVAFLQAFIFMFLTVVFLSLFNHHDHEHDHEAVPAH